MNQIAALGRAKQKRQDKLLDAAETLFAQFGFKAVTITAIAAEARVAKGTVYAYFEDKDAIFKAAAERLAARLDDEVRLRLSQDGTAKDRIATMLQDKHKIVFELVRSSPHVKELFTQSDRLTAGLFKDHQRFVERSIVETLIAAGEAPETAEQQARIVSASALGLAERAEQSKTLCADIRTLVEAVISHR